MPFNGSEFDGIELLNLNSTSFASQVITSSFSMLCYVVVFVLSVLSVCFKSIHKFLASPALHIFFLIAGILASVAVLNTCADVWDHCKFCFLFGGPANWSTRSNSQVL